MNVIFLRNESDSSAALDAILHLIDDTRGMLRIAVAYFNHLDIADRLVARSELGRPTRLLVNSSDLVRPREGHVEYEVSEAILRVLRVAKWPAAMEVGTLGLPSPNYHNMHHKFAVGDDRVLFGSVNWTRAALSLNYEYLVMERDSRIVAKFADEFDNLWERAHTIEGPYGTLRVIVCPKCQRSDSVDFESWGAYCTGCLTEFRPSRQM